MNIKDIIRERFPNEKTQDLADELGLTYSQLSNRAHSMGLKKSGSSNNLTNQGGTISLREERKQDSSLDTHQ